MFVDSYQVEVQNFVALHRSFTTVEKWTVVKSFRPQYKWRRVTYRILCGLLRRTRREIVGDPLVQALIVKSDAHRYAQNTMRTKYPQHVRITRTEREGAQLVKFVIWQDGKWLE